MPPSTLLLLLLPRPWAKGLALAFALACAGAVHAGVYKCLRDDGSVFYQEDPCAPGRELRDFQKDPATVSVVPFDTPRERPAPAKARKPAEARAGAREHAAKPGATERSRRARAGDPRERRFLRPGMSEGEVLARVGPPDMTSGKGRKGMRWTYMPVPEDRDTITNVTLEGGRVAGVERKVVK